MTKRLLAILFSLPLVTFLSYSQNSVNDTLLRDIVSRNGQAEVIIDDPGVRGLEWLSVNTSISSIRGKTVHIILSPRTSELFFLQNFDYKIVEQSGSKGIISSASVKQALEWESYPSYSQYDSIMQSFVLLYPSLCHLDTIGKSTNGKSILAIKISDNVLTDEDEPEVFYTSTIHGDETGGFIMMLRFVDYLLKNYNLNNRVKNLVDNLEIWINPLANPDGTYRTGNTISSPTRFNFNGYDLNRNFPDPDPLAPRYPVQKETLDMIKFMRHHKFVLSANFHSGAEVVNYPWDRWSRLHADDEWFTNISRKYADTVHFYSGPVYMSDLNNGITNGYKWYKVYGGRQDFVTYELHGREVTIELDYDFITPASQLSSLWQNNWHSLIGYLENAMYGIQGTVTGSNNNEPVAARIFINRHDEDNSQVYSDTLTGSFIRLLAPGSWDLQFTANGYSDTVISNIVVYEGQKTLLDVEMIPVPVHVPLLYPNPATTSLRILLPEIISGRANVMVFNQTGAKISDYNTIVTSGIPLVYNVSHLTSGRYNMVITNTLTKNSVRSGFIVIRK